MFGQPAERQIYEYWNGSEMVKVDPLPVWYDLCAETEGGGNFWEQLKSAGEGSVDAAKWLHDFTCKTFNVKSYDGESGLTMLETQRLMLDFRNYVGELKKRLESSRTASQSTDSTSSETPPDSTTPSESDSSSTPSESPSAEPG